MQKSVWRTGYQPTAADEVLVEIFGAGVAELLANPVDFLKFKRIIFKRYEHARHHALVDKALLDVVLYVETHGAEGIGHLMLNEPPRHGKTLNLGRLFPPWVIGKHPDWRVMLVSYAMSLARKSGRHARNIIASPVYQTQYPRVHLAKDSRAADSWDTTDGGGMDVMGVGGGVTGKGGHILITDDPVAGRAEAESLTIREKTWGWWTNDYYTRGEVDYAAHILSGTRWHEDDVQGRALRYMPGVWTVLNLPAIAEDADDPLGRKIGEALWQERWGIKRLLELKATLGLYAFSALYQGRPQPAGSRLFDTAHLDEVLYATEYQRTVRFWDLAITMNRSSDYSVGVKLGQTHDERYGVEDVARVQWEYPEVKKLIKRTAKSDGTHVEIVLEGEKTGIIILQELVRDPDLRDYTISIVTPDQDKYSRALPLSARVAADRVFLRRGDWNRDFKDELAVFPMGQHDDQVDAFSGAYNELSKPKGFVFQ